MGNSKAIFVTYHILQCEKIKLCVKVAHLNDMRLPSLKRGLKSSGVLKVVS